MNIWLRLTIIISAAIAIWLAYDTFPLVIRTLTKPREVAWFDFLTALAVGALGQRSRCDCARRRQQASAARDHHLGPSACCLHRTISRVCDCHRDLWLLSPLTSTNGRKRCPAQSGQKLDSDKADLLRWHATLYRVSACTIGDAPRGIRWQARAHPRFEQLDIARSHRGHCRANT